MHQFRIFTNPKFSDRLLLPYDPVYPVVCFDEASKQLFGEVRPAQRPRPGTPARMDYEYERKGVCHPVLMCEPLRDWRHVRVSARRTHQDDALCVRELVDVHYPKAKKIRMVQDNLNTHDGASLYESFPPSEARRLLDRLKFHDTPKHGSYAGSFVGSGQVSYTIAGLPSGFTYELMWNSSSLA